MYCMIILIFVKLISNLDDAQFVHCLEQMLPGYCVLHCPVFAFPVVLSISSQCQILLPQIHQQTSQERFGGIPTAL